MSTAQTVTLVLQEDVSSKLPTGITCTAKDSAGEIYHGHGSHVLRGDFFGRFDELGV